MQGQESQLLPDSVTAPVIDLSALLLPLPARSHAIEEIGRACKQYGFFEAINHGIYPSVMEDALSASRSFFDLPPEEKEEFLSDDVKKPVRYTRSMEEGSEKVPLRRMLLKHYAQPLEEWIKHWPSKPHDYRQKMGEYAVEARKLALRIMSAIMESLGVEPTCISRRLEQGMQVMAVNYYPPAPPDLPELLGLPPHSDYGCITILLKSCKGLQVLGPQDDTWNWVPEVPGSLHVHVGDHLEVLSNGQCKSVVHRVTLNQPVSRLSIASVHGLGMDDKVEALDELVDHETSPRRYRGSSFADYLNFISAIEGNMPSVGRYIESLKIAEA